MYVCVCEWGGGASSHLYYTINVHAWVSLSLQAPADTNATVSVSSAQVKVRPGKDSSNYTVEPRNEEIGTPR